MITITKLGLRYTVFDRANWIWLYQREVPKEAIWLLQRKKITVSLGKVASEAMRRYGKVHAKWQDAIDRAVADVEGEPDDDEFVDRLVAFLNAQAALNGGTLPEIDWCLNWSERHTLWKRWQEWNAVRDGHIVGPLADAWPGNAYTGDNLEVLDRLIEGWKIFKGAFRARVELTAQLPAPLPNANTPTKDGQIVMSLTDVETKWRKEKTPSAANSGDTKRMVKLFVALNGNLPVHEITASHRLKFRDAVQQITDKKGRSLKAQTQNKLMRTMAALGSFAEGLGVITANPLRAKGFEVTDEIIRESFTDDHLKIIFKSKAWKKRSPTYRKFIFWFFLIGAYTGARIGEIAQLRHEDISQHHGIWVIKFTFDHEEGGQRNKTRVARLVPVADKLIELGFLKLAQRRKTGQVFPEVKPNKDGQWSANVSPPVSRVIRGSGLPKEFVGHSWRHTLISRLRGKAEDSVVKRITHEGGGKKSVWDRYGDVETAEMKRVVDLLTYKVEWPKA